MRSTRSSPLDAGEDGAVEVPIQDPSEDVPVDVHVVGAVQGRCAVCGERGASGPTAADEQFDGGLVWVAARGPMPQSGVAVGLGREAHSVLLGWRGAQFESERRLPDAGSCWPRDSEAVHDAAARLWTCGQARLPRLALAVHVGGLSASRSLGTAGPAGITGLLLRAHWPPHLGRVVVLGGLQGAGPCVLSAGALRPAGSVGSLHRTARGRSC